MTCPTPSSTLWAARVPDALQTWIENETVITWSPRNPRVQLLWQALTDDTITAANGWEAYTVGVKRRHEFVHRATDVPKDEAE